MKRAPRPTPYTGDMLTLPSWTVWVVVALACIAVAWQLIPAWLRARKEAARWKPLPGLQNKVRFSEGVVLDSSYVAARYLMAVDALSTVWGAERVVGALGAWNISVLPFETWKNYLGQTVAGETFLDAGYCAVGPSLDALAHELAHVCEDRIEGRTDYSHASWTSRGIYAAISKYEHGE
jgi:hypothetical protein